MARHFSSLSILMLLGTLLAGCSGTTGGLDVNALRDCALRFPDDSLVDCTKDVGAVHTIAEPAGWICAQEIKSGFVPHWVQLWTDQKGRFGVKGHIEAGGDTVTRIRIKATDGNSKAAESFHHARDYFVPFGVTFNSSEMVDWWVETRNFTGYLDIDSAINVSVNARVSQYEESLWFVWAFEGPDATYYSQSMGSFTVGTVRSWVPSNLRDAGKDYHLRVHVGKPVGSHGQYVPDEPSLVPDVPWPDPLPDRSTPRCTV